MTSVSEHPNRKKKKLIEVAIPLDAINKAAVREKNIKKGHPSTLHLWWARRPLAVCRAVLFCQLVDDPSEYMEGEAAIEQERERLFNIIEELVKWENTTSEAVLEKARAEIRRCWGDSLPPVYDPFSGGATIPLEAQRLGLPAHGSDLNPVAVLVGKATIEFPPRFQRTAPQPAQSKENPLYHRGLIEDIRYCAGQINKRAWEKIGHLYPKVPLPAGKGGEGTVIAWFWERTIPSPNPRAQGAHVPLIRTYYLCNKPKKDKVWREPYVSPAGKIAFAIRHGTPTPDEAKTIAAGTKRGRGAHFTCLLTGDAITPDYVKAQGKAGRMGWILTAIVAEGNRERVYLEANEEHAQKAFSQTPHWRPDNPFPPHSMGINVTGYGLENVSDLFMDRQTIALTTFLDLIPKVVDAIDASPAYRQALTTYLALWVSNCAKRQSTNAIWHTGRETVEQVFGRQALGMVWGTAEGNPFSSSTGNFLGQVDYLTKAVAASPSRGVAGKVVQQDAREVDFSGYVLSTDPPYYDVIGYADLSDFFYVWLRRALRQRYPELFQTTLTPKAEELVANHKRQGGRGSADQFFLDGMKAVISNMAKRGHPDVPATLYYALLQSEKDKNGISYRGWVTFLQAVVDSGYAVNATWPVRTELTTALKTKKNALSTSVVLACRPRPANAGTTTRSEFIRQLKRELPDAIRTMRQANIAPVDVPQASIGPGIGIFSRYRAVLESNDDKMTIKHALQLINHWARMFLNGKEGFFDNETNFARTWFAQNGYHAGKFGDADSVVKGYDVSSVASLSKAGIAESSGGKVRLLRREELPKEEEWDPRLDPTPPIWACCQHLIRAHDREGEEGAAKMLVKMNPDQQAGVKNLAEEMHTICERRSDQQEATAYNSLINAWGTISDKAAKDRNKSKERILPFEK
ncbi:MAG: DUF1156 domain-containing protein [Rhodobacteraceae bacterium]|nr:DUF1156 domain-containing protein [Paracoccaceae bacterium]